MKSAVAGYGAADKDQVQRMVQMVLGMAELPRPDDAADALADRHLGGQHRAARGRPRRSAVMDRAAVAPIERGATPYERAVREAMAREKSETRRTKRSAS